MDTPPDQQRRVPPQPPVAPGRGPVTPAFRDDEVGPAVKLLEQVGDGGGVVQEVGVNHDRGVPAGAVAQRHRVAEQALDGPGVSLVPVLPQDGEREDLGVGLQHLRRGVGGGVVADQQVVFAVGRGEQLPDLPEQQPDRRRFVSAWNADVEHRSSVG